MPTTRGIILINNVSSSSDSISPPENTFSSPSGIIEKAIVRCEIFATDSVKII